MGALASPAQGALEQAELLEDEVGVEGIVVRLEFEVVAVAVLGQPFFAKPVAIVLKSDIVDQPVDSFAGQLLNSEVAVVEGAVVEIVVEGVVVEKFDVGIQVATSELVQRTVAQAVVVVID